MTKKVKLVLELLDEYYPFEDTCYLHYEKPYELMIATILSAQCTDDRVNIVTKDLFQKYQSIEDFANADLKEMEQDVKTTGFYHNKALHIIGAMQMLLTQYNKVLPSDIEELIKFPGVGRKTANVVRGHIFKIPAVVVDTHVKRISKKIGLTQNTDPEKIEFDLMKILPKKAWIRYNHQIIAHGRKICMARKPDCENCFMAAVCDTNLAASKK